MREKKIYTATDFERYHTGGMPVSEMHGLEKAALEDPFLADALEGYALASSAQSDMLKLRERLFEKEKNKNATPVYTLSRSAWWRIAALFIIIAGAGIIFYRININSKQKLTGKTDDKEFSRADSTVSLSNDARAPSQDIVAFENSSAVKSGENKVIPLPETKVEPDKKIYAPFSLEKELQTDMANLAVNNKNKKSFNESVLKGKVTDHEGSPLAAASVKESNYDAIPATDSSANFSIIFSDSNTKAIVSASGYGTKQAVLTKDSKSVIAMDKSNGAANEALLASADRSKAARKKQMESGVLGAQMKSAVPAASNPRFDEYLKTHIKSVYNENKVRQRGEVKLSFNISKEGKPENIKIESSSCEACEAQAIELLKNGPLWNNKTSTGKTVLIKF